MKKIILTLVICFPLFLMAQKGIIMPDEKSNTTTNYSKQLSNDIKIWTIEENLVNCIDSTTKCFIFKENGITKIISEENVFHFIYEDGYKFTIQVKEELKTPPVALNEGNYTYTLVKIISKKLIDKNATQSDNSYVNIPTVSKSTTNTISSKTDENDVEIPVTNFEAASKEEITSLKKNIQSLKKQVDVMQLQMEMLMQVIIKK